MSHRFIAYQPTPNDCWRGIILFGNNVATYKFALARALLDLKPTAGQLIKLDELAVPYSKHLCEHLRLAAKQSTSPRSGFIDSCRKANAGELDQQKLVNEAVRLGFENVIDAFHIVNREPVPKRFFIDERAIMRGIRITDSFAQLLDGQQASNLPEEAESRWRLVETAWEQKIHRALLTINHDPDTEALFVIDAARRRKPVTGARNALSGYQKGHCFYCSESYLLQGPGVPDVDHFFPHRLKALGLGGQIDGVWNLVLACARCNRGPAGKSGRVPSLKLLERLSIRNQFLIESHHPLRETLRAQTGANQSDRRSFLNAFHAKALGALIHAWEPQEVQTALF